MTSFDPNALWRTVNGSGRETMPIQWMPGETEIIRVTASRNPGGLRGVGGDLLLTTKRLIFTPLNVKDIAAILSYGLSKAGVDSRISGLPGKVAEVVGDAGTIGPETLTGIASIEAGTEPRLFKPPTLILTATEGTRTEVGILAGRMVPNLSPRNTATRDQFILKVRQTMTPL